MRYLSYTVCGMILALLLFNIIGNAQDIPYADRKPLIDEELKKYELKIKKEIEECEKNAKRYIEELSCGKETRKKHRIDKDNRPSEHYCEKYYKPLSDNELNNAYEKLKEQTKIARRDEDVVEREPGEMTIEMLNYEIQWLQREYADRKSKRRIVK